MKRMNGVCVPMITPMDEHGMVDYESLYNLTDHLISRGISALYPCGTTGEVMNLTAEERKEIVRTVVKATGKRVPVFAQIGGGVTEEAVELAKAAYSDGADGLGLLTPTYYRLSDEELFAYISRVSGSVPEEYPIYLYGIPGCAGNSISYELALRVAKECSNVIGIKYSVDEILKLMKFRRIRKNTFDVLVAPVQMLLPALAAGMCGVVSGNCNVFPEYLNEMFLLFRDGRIEECRELQEKIAVLADEMAVKEIAKCKALLARKGIIRTDTVRLPQQGLTWEEKEKFFSFVDENYELYSYKAIS